MAEVTYHACMHWRRKWQPTPVSLPKESQGQRSLVGCHLWGRIESDTTEAAAEFMSNVLIPSMTVFGVRKLLRLKEFIRMGFLI